MGLYFNGEARDTCWDRGMFRGYVLGYVSGYVSGMFRGIRSYFTCNFGGMLRGMFRGYVSGYVTGYVSRVCNPCAILKPEPPKKTQTHINPRREGTNRREKGKQGKEGFGFRNDYLLSSFTRFFRGLQK